MRKRPPVKYIEGPKIVGRKKDLNEYGKVLALLLRQIESDIRKEILPLYEQSQMGRANDGLLDNIFAKIKILIGKYSNPKKTIQDTQKFAKINSDYVFREKKKFSRKNDIAIQWNPSKRTDQVLQQAISENVDLIRTIPKKYLEDVKKEFYKATRNGWDVQRIHKVLIERHGISERRAFNIAVDQRNKVINAVNKQTNIDAGQFWVKWQHQGGVKDPRVSHERAHGTIYDIRDGCLIDGNHIATGEEYNCHCFNIMVIPTVEQKKSFKGNFGMAA